MESKQRPISPTEYYNEYYILNICVLYEFWVLSYLQMHKNSQSTN